MITFTNTQQQSGACLVQWGNKNRTKVIWSSKISCFEGVKSNSSKKLQQVIGKNNCSKTLLRSWPLTSPAGWNTNVFVTHPVWPSLAVGQRGWGGEGGGWREWEIGEKCRVAGGQRKEVKSEDKSFRATVVHISSHLPTESRIDWGQGVTHLFTSPRQGIR